MTQLVLPHTWLERLPPALRDAYGRAADHVANPHAPNTQRAYRRTWEAWALHCRTHGIVPLPVSPEHLCAWLDYLSHGALAPNSVRLQFAAMCALDQGHAVSIGDTERPALRRLPYVQRWLKGWSKEHAEAPIRQAPALATKDIGRVLELAAEPGHNQSRVAHAARYARDKCILLLGIAGGYRASELAGLDLGDVLQTPRGLELQTRRSKTDQTGRGKWKGILPQAARATCPVEAFGQWTRVRGTTLGPLFVPIARNGLIEERRLTTGQLERVIMERCRAAGLALVTSHSLRATFGTLTKDKSLSAVMEHVGWQSAEVALRYQRRGKLLDADNPTGGLFDDR